MISIAACGWSFSLVTRDFCLFVCSTTFFLFFASLCAQQTFCRSNNFLKTRAASIQFSIHPERHDWLKTMKLLKLADKWRCWTSQYLSETHTPFPRFQQIYLNYCSYVFSDYCFTYCLSESVNFGSQLYRISLSKIHTLNAKIEINFMVDFSKPLGETLRTKVKKNANNVICKKRIEKPTELWWLKEVDWAAFV